jgi:hypothetical protein
MVALGRRLHHDPRSRRFPAPRAATVKSVLWTHNAPVLDRGRFRLRISDFQRLLNEDGDVTAPLGK